MFPIAARHFGLVIIMEIDKYDIKRVVEDSDSLDILYVDTFTGQDYIK